MRERGSENMGQNSLQDLIASTDAGGLADHVPQMTNNFHRRWCRSCERDVPAAIRGNQKRTAAAKCSGCDDAGRISRELQKVKLAEIHEHITKLDTTQLNPIQFASSRIQDGAVSAKENR